MTNYETVTVETDLLVLGGGMAACGAAIEASHWAKKNNVKITVVDKAAMDRSGAVAMGLSAINQYVGLAEGKNTVQDYVEYVRNDLMVLDKDKMKAFNREPEMCWECYNCVKICPQQAVDVRGYADFVPMGGSVVPLRSSDSIMWTVKFRNGMVKRFKFPIRTTPEGKADPSGGFATESELDSVGLFTEPQSLRLPKVWTKS